MPERLPDPDTDHPDELLLVRKETLHDQVANQIRDLIIEGVLEPGGRIDETSFVARLGVSRTPFREAIRTLAAEGLVVIRPARSSLVRKWSPHEIRSMLEALAHLEALVGQLVCERASDTEVADLIRLHEQMMEFYAARDRLPYYKLNQSFHSRLAELCGNPTLSEMQANIQARLKRIRFMGNATPERWAAAVEEHEEMANALRSRDGLRLSEVMARHLDNTWDRVRNSV